MQDDGNALAINLLKIGVPFAAFFLGIVIRKIALPGKNSPSLRHQCLLGVPVSLVIVSPLLTIFSENLNNMSAYLLTVGIIIEHGMLVTETAIKHMRDFAGAKDTANIGISTLPSR